jgi:serine/threonine protein phosphatase PrpC
MADQVTTAVGNAWSFGGASVRGAAHIRRGQPNQDAIGWLPATITQGVRSFAAAVSDGHGAAPYYRSDVGARLAVEAAKTVLGRFLEAPDPPADPRAVAAEILAGWRAAVMQDLAGNPIDADWIDSEQERLLPYGATLAAVAVRPDRLIAVQVGDGDMLLGYPDGRLERPLPSDQGLIGEQTYSLCLDDAIERFRVRLYQCVQGQPWPDFVMLSTDGVAKSFADEKAFQSIARDYRASVRRMGLGSVLAQLETWLNDVTQRGSGDDVTLYLAVGTPATAAEMREGAEEVPETWV